MPKECKGEGPIAQAYKTLGESGADPQIGGLTRLVDDRWQDYEATGAHAELLARDAARRQAAADLARLRVASGDYQPRRGA